MILGPEDFKRLPVQWMRWSRSPGEWVSLGCELIGILPATFQMNEYCLQFVAEQIRQPWVEN